jgi:hypothetical protein
MNKTHMKASDSKNKQNTQASSSRKAGERLLTETTKQKMAIKTSNCRNSAKLARKQAPKAGYCLSNSPSELARLNTIKITNCQLSTELARQMAPRTKYCLSSAELAHRKSYKTTNCLSSARARPAETVNRLSTVLSPAPADLLLARKSKQTPKNCHDSCMSPSFSATKQLKRVN